jgi:methionyl-tRNA formyltransferase
VRVLFWGTPGFALPALRALGEEGHDVVAVVTQPDRPAGRGQALGMSPVKREAMEEAIPVLQPERVRGDEFVRSIAALEADVSVVVAYGQILPREVLEVPPRGSINIHASLLPELRGAAPVHWAVIRGYETSGVTIMKMEAGLDSGPILFQLPEPVRPDETMGELTTRLSEIGAEALIDTLAMMEVGEAHEEPQDHSRATYAPKDDRAIARVNWSLPAIEIARWIRGVDPGPGAWTTLAGREVKLFIPRVEVHPGEPGVVLEVDEEMGMLVGAGHEAIRIQDVQPAGRRRIGVGEWSRGRGVRVGDRFE